MALYLPIILMILATTVYHVAQKSVPSQVNPVFSLVMNYLVALLGTLLLSPIYAQRKADLWSWKSMNWGSCVVGISIIGIELGVLLAYRTGWKISLVSVIGNTASALFLVSIGVFFFHEHLSVRSLAGVALCLAGLALITEW
jgi:drug/metabolite transporter (DMT)-like permease